jgi:hypothetical protein
MPHDCHGRRQREIKFKMNAFVAGENDAVFGGITLASAGRFLPEQVVIYPPAKMWFHPAGE